MAVEGLRIRSREKEHEAKHHLPDIGSLKGTAGFWLVPGARDRRGHVLCLEVEVRWDGCERGATAEDDGRREPSSEAAGSGAESAWRGVEGSDTKKRLELAGLRGDVAFVSSEYRLSESTACKLLGVGAVELPVRTSARPQRGVTRRVGEAGAAEAALRLPAVHALLSRRGQEVNVKRVYRLYVEEGLMVRRRSKRLVRERAIEPRLTRANQESAMDFIVDGLATGRMVRILSVVDTYRASVWRWKLTPA